MMYTTPNDLSREKFEQVVVLLKSRSKNQYVIAREVGTSQATVSKISRGIHFYQLGRHERKRPKQAERRKKSLPKLASTGHYGRLGEYIPTPEEIVLACKMIRDTWPDERLEFWEPPVCFTADLQAA